MYSLTNTISCKEILEMGTVQVGLRLDEDLLERLGEWIEKQPIRTTRTAVIEAAIEAWLDAKEE